MDCRSKDWVESSVDVEHVRQDFVMYTMTLKGFEILKQDTHRLPLGDRRRVFLCMVQQQR